MSARLMLASMLALPLLACGPHGKTGVPEGQTKPWSEMDDDERMAHMGAVVMPRLQAVFQEHDPERFATFGCVTCHGNGARDGNFEMPNPDLPQLDAANLYKKHRQEAPEMTKLMWKKVEPALGEALAQTYGLGDAQVSCKSCHIVNNAK
jgi:cytochrome c553